jgi:hypothetical protein
MYRSAAMGSQRKASAGSLVDVRGDNEFPDSQGMSMRSPRGLGEPDPQPLVFDPRAALPAKALRTIALILPATFVDHLSSSIGIPPSQS